MARSKAVLSIEGLLCPVTPSSLTGLESGGGEVALSWTYWPSWGFYHYGTVVCVQISVAKRSFVAFPSEHKGHLGQIYIRATVVHLDT